MSKIVTIYDSDALAYRAAAVVDKRLVEIEHIKSGRKKTFNTRTEFKELLKSKDMLFNKEDYVFTDKIISGELAHAIKIMKNQVEKINSDLIADEMLMCIQSNENFRDSLPLPSKYKGSRTTIIRPTWLRECKLYLYKNYPSYVAKGFEVDDAVIFRGYEEVDKGNYPVIVGVDKDAKAYSGLTLYDYTQDNPELKLIPDFGSLWVGPNKKIKGEGFIWFCFQFLNGDSSDDYKPCELAKIKFGEQSAYKILKDCTTHKEALEKVLGQYKEWYPEKFTYTAWDGTEVNADYLDIAQLYYCCARMMTTEDDKLKLIPFLDKYGVKI